MTPEQLQHLRDLTAPLTTTPAAYADLSPELQNAMMAMVGSPSFSPEQREYLSYWWLAVTPEQADEINSLCPPHTQYPPRAAENGDLYLGSDMLTDAIPGRPLEALWPILTTLPITWYELIEWPAPPVYEEE